MTLTPEESEALQRIAHSPIVDRPWRTIAIGLLCGVLLISLVSATVTILFTFFVFHR